MKKLAILLLAAFVALPAAAQKPLRFMASEDVSYDDNIYLTKDNEKDSFVSTTRVGADYEANIPGSGLTLSATGLVGYNAYTEDSSKNNYWDTLGRVEVANEQFKIGDRFLYTSDPANNELTDRAKRINNLGYASFKTSSEKTFGFGVSVDDSFDRYTEAEWQYLNRNRLNAGLQLYYNVSAKTNFFAEYTYSDITYQDNKLNNSYGNTFGLGVNGQLAPKVTGTAKITYAMRDYDHSLAGASNYNDLLGYFAALEWKATENDTVRLSGERKMEETLYGVNRYFADTVVSLYGAHKFLDKWTASLTLAWENMDYSREFNGTKRADDLYTIRPQVDYQFKEWLSAGVWYQFRTRSSDVNWAEYDSNKGGVFVKALF